MSPRTMLSFAFSSIAARPGRSLALAGGVTLCIALYVALNTLADGYARLVRQPLEDLSADVAIQFPGAPKAAGTGGRITTPPANTVLSADEVVLASALPHLAEANPALILWDRSPKGFTVIMGIEADARGGKHTGPSVVQEWVARGRPLQGDGDLLLEEHFAKLNRLKVGDRFDIGGKQLPITGLVKIKEGGSLIPANAFVTLNQARSISDLPQGSANVLFARLKKGADVNALRGELTSRLPGAIVTASDSIGDMMRGFGVVSGQFAAIVGALALAFAAMACHRLISGAVQERCSEFGVMKAIGWQHKDISGVLTVESASIGLFSGAAGILLGYLIAVLAGDLMLTSQAPLLLSPLPSGVRPVASESVAVHLPVALSWITGITALIVSCAVAGGAGWLVSRRISKACVMDSLRQT